MILHEKSHVGIAIGVNVTRGFLRARVRKGIAIDVFVHLNAHLFDLFVKRTSCVEGFQRTEMTWKDPQMQLCICIDFSCSSPDVDRRSALAEVLAEWDQVVT